MKQKIFAVALLTPVCIASAVRAESLTPIEHLQTNRLSNTRPILVAQVAWRDWASSQGRFTISMPGKPFEQTEKDQDGSVNYYLKYESEKDTYIVMYTDVPNIAQASPEKVNQILDRIPTNFVKGAEAKLLSQRSTSLAGYPAREFDFSFSNGISGKGRAYLVNQRLYVTIATTPQPEDAQKFLSSFQVNTK